MLLDFRDKNLDIKIMYRGTDATHNFQYTLDNGSVFLPSQYTVTCEGRLAYANETADFAFPVAFANTDSGWVGTITFPKTLVTTTIREDKIYYRVLAADNSGNTFVINYGEVWLK